MYRSIAVAILAAAATWSGDPDSKSNPSGKVSAPPPAVATDPKPAKSTPSVAGLELPAPFTVPYDEGFVTITAKCTGEIQWLVLTTDSVRLKYKTARDAPELDLAIPPQSSVISVFAVAVVDGKLTPFARTDVTVLGPKKPAPKPDPGPGPVVPAGSRLHITVVEDPTKRTPELAKLLTSATLLQEIRKAGHVFRVYSHRDPEVVLKKLDQFVAKAGGAPALIIQTDDGVVHRSVPVPGNEAAFLDIVKGIFSR